MTQPVDIRGFAPGDLAAVVALSLRAWAPVFASIEKAMDAEVFRLQHPDWRVTQKIAVEGVCADDHVAVFVATEGDTVTGFTALKCHTDDAMGEVYMIAVDPAFQRRGIARTLTAHALDWFRGREMTTVMVETGGDPGHEPARRTYEAAGLRLFPVARYFGKL